MTFKIKKEQDFWETLFPQFFARDQKAIEKRLHSQKLIHERKRKFYLDNQNER